MNGKKILIVDDNDVVLEALEHGIALRHPECRVVLAQDGFSALDRFKQQPFDLVVTDYQMPGMTGVDLAAHIRRLSPQTPIVLMSANLYEAEANSKAHKIALDGYLEKPIAWDKFWALTSRKNLSKKGDLRK